MRLLAPKLYIYFVDTTLGQVRHPGGFVPFVEPGFPETPSGRGSPARFVFNKVPTPHAGSALHAARDELGLAFKSTAQV
jgi:hypothetical protein